MGRAAEATANTEANANIFVCDKDLINLHKGSLGYLIYFEAYMRITVTAMSYRIFGGCRRNSTEIVTLTG